MRAKPLEWRKPKNDGQDYGHEDMTWIADGIGGLYCIQDDSHLNQPLLWWAHDPFIWTAHATVEAAKSVAEADWQAKFIDRIRTD